MPMPSRGASSITEVPHEGTVVIIGANGSGKSRLGHWFEATAIGTVTGRRFPVRRISAHRMLSIPSIANRLSLEQANNRVEYGNDHVSASGSRVQGDAIVGIMQDFAFVVEALFAVRDAQALSFLQESADESRALRRPPQTILERAKAMWEEVFSERQLVIGDYLIEAKPVSGGAAYTASQLSDGERVGFYLIAHALLAPPDTTILIDEPELHLHESIQSSLWDEIESARDDCSFIYITHDLGFAASRTEAPKILLRDFNQGASGPEWDWELAPEGTGLPEDVVLRIAGSRRPSLFVEGMSGSIDQELYEAAYPDYYVIPSESCEGVIRSAQAFRRHAALHRFSVQGIIDRDDRDTAEIASLASIGVHALPYAQAENILAAREVMEVFLTHLRHPSGDIPARIADAESRIRLLLKRERDVLIAMRAKYAVERRLHAIAPTGYTLADLQTAVATATTAADPVGTYTAAEFVIDAAIASGSHDEALAVLRNKGVLAAVAQAMGTSVREYRRLTVALIREDKTLRGALARVLPVLP